MLGLAFKVDDCVYMASLSNGNSAPSASYVESNMTLWAPKLCKNALVAYLGDCRPLNVVRYYKEIMSGANMPDGKLTTNYIMRNVFKKVVSNLKEGQLISEDDDVDTIFAPMLLAKDDSLFSMDLYGNVREIQDYVAAGMGFDRAMAAMYVYKDIKDPILKICKVMVDVISSIGGGTFPIIIRNTKEPDKCLAFGMDAAIAYIRRHEGGSK